MPVGADQRSAPAVATPAAGVHSWPASADSRPPATRHDLTAGRYASPSPANAALWSAIHPLTQPALQPAATPPLAAAARTNAFWTNAWACVTRTGSGAARRATDIARAHRRRQWRH